MQIANIFHPLKIYLECLAIQIDSASLLELVYLSLKYYFDIQVSKNNK